VISRGEIWWAELPKGSVVNVSQIVTLDKRQLSARVGAVDHDTLGRIDAGVRLVLDLVT
jgi:mRNA-degrading endonuclease toxin of MazEF toxin-antitoxin module